MLLSRLETKTMQPLRMSQNHVTARRTGTTAEAALEVAVATTQATKQKVMLAAPTDHLSPSLYLQILLEIQVPSSFSTRL